MSHSGMGERETAVDISIFLFVPSVCIPTSPDFHSGHDTPCMISCMA